MKINNITPGFVLQTYDTEQKQWIGRSLWPVIRCIYEDASTGQTLDPADIWPDGIEPYLPFDMKQPLKE